MRLLAVAVGEPAPDRGQQAGEQGRHADEGPGPERGRLLARSTPRSRTKRGRNGRTKAKPVKTTNTTAVITYWLRCHGSTAAEAPRIKRAGGPRPPRARPGARATPACGPRSRGTGHHERRGPGSRTDGGVTSTTTSRHRTPCVQPVPMALLAASLPAMARASAVARGPRLRGRVRASSSSIRRDRRDVRPTARALARPAPLSTRSTPSPMTKAPLLDKGDAAVASPRKTIA